jgi:hypothetical protein
MSKKRTRKHKIQAKHDFKISLEEGSGKLNFEPSVKRQSKITKKTSDKKLNRVKNSDSTVNLSNLGTIKKDITKSLILAGMIFASEIMLYLIWK